MSDPTSQASRIVWFEIPSEDTARAQDFYRGLFGWKFAPFEGMDYHASEDGGGGVYHSPGTKGVMVYFGVADVGEAAKRVSALGGIVGDREEIPGVGSYVQCQDLDGNKFGLYQDAAS